MSWTINSKTAKTAWTDTDKLVIQESGGTVKKLALSVLRKIIPASDSTSAFRVTKADGTTDVLTVDSVSGRIGVNTSSPLAAIDVVGGVLSRGFGSQTTITSGRTNGTESAPTAVQNGDILGAFSFYGRGATEDIISANILAGAEGGFTNSSAPTFIDIRTTQAGSTTPAITIRATASGAVTFNRIATTASAANAFLDPGAGNSLLRSTSSRKYKTDIVTLDDSSTLDSLRPVLYKSNPETVPGDDPTKEHYGFIAEELDEIDEKLVQYVDGVPDGVQYDRIVVLLVKRIHELEARLAKAGI